MASILQVQRDKMRNIAKDMRDELKILQSNSVGALENGVQASGTVGQWNVASAYGRNVDNAHKSMLAVFERFIVAYEEVVASLDKAEMEYTRREQLTADQIRQLGLQWAQPGADPTWTRPGMTKW